MDNYTATVVRIKDIRPHTNADRLVCTNIFGNNVIVGKDTKEGDLGIFFPLEAQLGIEFAKGNDLLRRKDENGKPCGGMFDENRRVRCQTFRGEKSMGFFIPIDSLSNIFPNGKALDVFEEGQEIGEYLGVTISSKYIPKNILMGGGAPKLKKGQKPRESKVIDGQFHFHFDTAQLGKNIHRLSSTDNLVITWKLHGTSAIVSNSLVKKKLSWVERLAKRIGVSVKDSHYEYLYASRRVIKNEFMEAKQHFYSYDLWTEVGKQFEGKLHTGESVYYEIVGFLKDGGYIQKGFDYKCKPGENKIFVYRITRTAPDGSVTELQWNQVKDRCLELNVNPVPEIWYGKGYTMVEDIDTSHHWQENFFNHLKTKYVYDQDSIWCDNKVPEEGICVRKDGLDIEVFKLKAFKFLEYETKSLDNGVVDVETEQTITE